MKTLAEDGVEFALERNDEAAMWRLNIVWTDKWVLAQGRGKGMEWANALLVLGLIVGDE